MKKKYTLIIAVLFLCAVQAWAQAPNALNYQGIARGAGGSIIPNQQIGLEFTIHQVSALGPTVYQETQKTTTNQFGLFTVAIGEGTVVSGTFSTINWGTNNEYLDVAMDPTGGTNYTDMGTQQFLSVPYALSAGSVQGGGLTGIGTVKYVPHWTSSNGLSTGGELLDNDTTVGINTVPYKNDMVLILGSAATEYSLAAVNTLSATATGVVAQNMAPMGLGSGNGIVGQTYQGGGFGAVVENFYTATPDVGTGLWGIASTTTDTSLNVGEGVMGTGNDFGVIGYAQDASPSSSEAGGYFCSKYNTYYAYDAFWNGTTNYKILGTGTVSTIVKDGQNDLKAMACPEAPEILFEDYGTSVLINGTVHIDLDATYAKNVTVNDKHPLRVMITMNDACAYGVYVTNRSSTGFDVVENNNGTSNASFTYEVIANRADETDNSGKIISKNADVRFPDAPGPLKSNTASVPLIIPSPVKKNNQ